ncbi:MAG: methionine synthase [Clostridia bacterium]|nr:methionine synthase [Clostridia bacterium]
MNEEYIDRATAMRYMGIKGVAPDGFSAILDECEGELCRAMAPRCVYTVKDISALDSLMTGEDIKRHLEGCRKAVVFAATLGAGVDALIRKYQSVDVTRAMVVDAEASAAIEKFCDAEEANVLKKTERFLTWRYSPGYGDFPLDVQPALLDAVDAGRKIGLFASESLMLSPSKSVTALMGVSDSAPEAARSSCSSCSMNTTCSYRKDGIHCGDQ